MTGQRNTNLILFSCDHYVQDTCNIFPTGSCKENKQSTITVRDIKQEDGEKVVPPPPPPPRRSDFDPGSFNVFVVDTASIYYYYDSSFQDTIDIKTSAISVMNKKLLRKSTIQKINQILREFTMNGQLTKERIWFVSYGDDEEYLQTVIGRVLDLTEIKEIMIGTISPDLHTLLKSVQ